MVDATPDAGSFLLMLRRMMRYAACWPRLFRPILLSFSIHFALFPLAAMPLLTFYDAAMPARFSFSVCTLDVLRYEPLLVRRRYASSEPMRRFASARLRRHAPLRYASEDAAMALYYAFIACYSLFLRYSATPPLQRREATADMLLRLHAFPAPLDA